MRGMAASRPHPQVLPHVGSVDTSGEEQTRIVRASTPPGEPERRASSVGIPPKFIEIAGKRLCGISIFVAAITLAFALLHALVDPSMASLYRSDPVVRLVLLAMVLLSVGIAALRRHRVVAARTLLVIGMVFEVTIAFCIAMLETTLPFDPSHPVRGIPSAAVWILAVGLLVPKRPMWTAIVALAGVSMWPVAYAINVWLRELPPLPTERLALHLGQMYSIALFTAIVGRRTFGREMEAHKAQDLGAYHLVALISRGGMGEVWRARHKMLAREAAIKIVRSDMIARAPAQAADLAVRRFEREARATASLQSPNTVYLYDFGTARDGSFYYVMELLDGISLQKLVASFGPQPAGRVVHFMKQVCRSLEEAHCRGLVHRDLKPSNLMACKVALDFDVVKVLDFGLVKPTGREDLELTADGVSAGTPAYIAPEVALGEREIDGRVDIYALGCVAYYLLTGQLVFDEPTATAMSIAHVQRPAPPPSTRSELPIPPALERLVLQCLEKNPADRPQSARDLHRMLEELEDVPPWTRADAAAWWRTHLPESSTLRTCTGEQQQDTPAVVQVA